MKTWITLGIFIIWCEEMGFVVGMKKDPRAPPSRNQRSNPGQNMPPPRQDNPFRLPLPTIYKKTCAPTKYSYDYSSPPLVMDCARFNTVYQIVVEQIDFVKGGNCASLADSFCFSGVDWDYKAKTGILEANGHGYWEISNVSPVFSTKCLSTSTHVFVTYSCRDTSARREMCEDVYFSTSGVVDLTTPSYPFDFPESPYMVACRCKASTGENGGIRLTLLDLNFTNPNGGCEGHYFSNGSVVDWNRLSGGYGGDQNYACYPNIPTPLNITYYKRSVSFVYMSYVDDGTAIYKRGAWFQLKGVRLTGDPDVQNVRLTIQCETVMDTSSGSGWLEETWETTQIPSPTRRSATRFTKLSYRPSTSTPYPTNTHQKTSSTPVTPPNQEGTIKPAGHKDNFIGVAVGVAVGGLVALALFAVAVFLCLRRRSLDETSDMETKGTISPSGPTLPPRNPGMKRSVKSGGHTVPEYFEPLDDSLYCIPEEVAKDTAPYAVLEGADNPQYLVPVINRSPNNPQQTPIATCQPTYEDGHPAVDDDSFSDYDNAETMPDYENTREALETKSSGEYYNLPDQAKSSDMESVSMGRPLENKNSGGYCNVVDHVPSPELNSNTKTPLENKNSGGYCGLVDPGVSNATDSVYQPLGS